MQRTALIAIRVGIVVPSSPLRRPSIMSPYRSPRGVDVGQRPLSRRKCSMAAAIDTETPCTPICSCPPTVRKLSAKAIVQALPLAKALLEARVVVLYATPIYKAEESIDGGARLYSKRHKGAIRSNGRARGRPRSQACGEHGGGSERLIARPCMWSPIRRSGRRSSRRRESPRRCDAIVMASHTAGGVFPDCCSAARLRKCLSPQHDSGARVAR